MKNIITLFIICLLSTPLFAQKVKVIAIPSDASIYEIKTGGVEQKLGDGSAEIRLNKDFPIQILVKKPGYKPVSKSMSRNKSGETPKEEKIELKERLVVLNAEPFDAKIHVNGVEFGGKKINVIIPENSSTTVTVSKPGFYKKTKTYYNQSGRDLPPLEDIITLEDKAVKIKLYPNDTQIYVDGKKLPDNSDEVIIPKNTTVAVEYKKDGYASLERSYSSKEGMPEAPLYETITLKDRVIRVNTTPADATIKVDGRIVGNGEYSVKVVEGACVEVIVERPGFVSIQKNYCNQSNMQAPPINEHLALKTDEAYTSSILSDQANVNFSITLNANRSPEDSWKILNGIVTNFFDVIEMADKETSYLRTAWAIKNFPNNTIRTRIIVKPGNTGTAQYVVKIQSEASGSANTGAKDDEKFRQWERLLNTYKDVISEIQARLQ